MRRLLPVFALLALGCNPVSDRLDEAKVDAARLKADAVRRHAQMYEVRFDGPVKSLDELIPHMEERQQGLIDPWGQKYQFEYFADGPDATPRVVVWTTHPKTGAVISSPRELAGRVSQGK